MALRKSSVLLPEVFQTVKNSKFLNATVDQLISEPRQQRINGYIGRKFAPNYTVGDSYLVEIDNDRQNYQLEPAVVYKTPNKEIDSLTGYQDFVNSLKYRNVNVNTHSDLFSQEYYNYSGFVDLDKLVNYGEYFWLPAGPDSVQVYNNTVDSEKDYTVYRNSVNSSYEFDSADADPNPTLILARGGVYTFEVDQSGSPFWIQTEQGLSGVTSYSKNTSTREVIGVTNNGEDNGTITFKVPEADAQNEQINATLSANPDFATTLTYKQIHNVPLQYILDTYDGIDGQTEIDGKSLVFINTTTDETAWDQGALFDAYGFDDPDNPFDERTNIPIDTRYDVYAIEVNTVGGQDIVQLRRDSDWPSKTKIKIKQGNSYGNREFYKDASGLPEIIAPYTAGKDTLYYQDGTDANRFGKIKLIELDTIAPIDVVEDIIGKLSYTSNNGVKLTNGLKIEFNSDVTPSTYAGREYFVEGVGQPQGIDLVPVDEMLTPETYTVSTSDGYDTVAYDSGGFDGTLNAPTQQDYITINRASPDRNAWSRGNRWFHREVIEATATYNDYTADIDDNARAKRPIIEFYTGLELFNMGTSSVAPVTVVDTLQTDALSNVNGSAGYFADGIDLQQGNTVIFSADTDLDVAKTIYRVDYIDQDSDINTNEIINLVAIGTVVDGNCVLSTLGANNQGKQYWLDGNAWRAAQQKTKINQDPLFDIFDPDHVSFSDTSKYPSSNFVGTKLFSYKRNNNVSPDTVLEFGLTYQNFSSIGDIVFENNFDSDKFQYTKSSGNVDVIIRSGHAHQFNQNGERSLYNGWTKVLEPSQQYQIVSHNVGSEKYSFEIGAKVDTTKTRQPLQVFVNGAFKYSNSYTHLVQYDREYVVFNDALNTDDVVTIKFVSATKAQTSFYEVPDNLENNAANEVFETLTLGQIRNHQIVISRQIKSFVGTSPGKSNFRDLNFRAYPGKILQHSAGLILPIQALSDRKTGLVESINYTKNEYTKFKNRFIDSIDKLDIDLTDPSQCVDDIILHLAGKKTQSFPFFYSDMLPWGNQKTQLVYTIDDATETEFEFNTQFDLTSVSDRGVLVYHNTTLLTHGKDYTFDSVEAKVILTTSGGEALPTINLAVDDTITIVEYSNTDGSFIPPTPSKLGLFYQHIPEKYTDNTYNTSKTVIKGHDGSIWVGWGDIRDDVVLEFERRVYNNIKTRYDKNLFNFSEIVPGYYRSTLDSLSEFTNIIRSYYGEWSLKNRVNTMENTIFDSDNPFTWNYRNSVLKTDGSRLPGYWRAIYRWLYDTDTPHTTPWEMLGLTEKPNWWNDRYGPAPYTRGNTVLWENLRDGMLYSDATGTTYETLSDFARPNLLDIIPVTEQGELLAPADFLVQDATETNTNNSWSFSDESPSETAWRRSSEYPYVVQIASAVLRSAKYGTLMFDTNMFAKDTTYDQILQKGKSYRPSLSDFKMHGQTNGTGIHRVEGYNQFVSAYATFNSYSIDDTINKINNLDLNLCYGMAGFTDKNFIKVIAESVTPSSQSENIFIPDEDLNIYTKKSSPLERVVYSGVQIIKRATGYEIQGYDVENPFFKIIPSVTANPPAEITVGQRVLFEFTDFENRIVNIPYGLILRSRQQVFDFLVSYQRYLLSRGFVFDGTTGVGGRNDFVSGGQEFAFWSDQGWDDGSVIVISPFHDILTLNRAYATVDNLQLTGSLKDANGAVINPKYYDVSRTDNIVEIRIDTDNTQLYSARLDPIQYEHALVFNNTTIFNDIIYQPSLGNRHERLKLVGAKSGDWNGTLHAPGFFINSDQINLWESYVDYKKGDIVSYQGKNYVAKGTIDGKKTFDFNEWKQADNIQTGLIKNLTNKANQFNNFFEMDNLNLEDGVDKLGKGIIGFNAKSYLEGLGLDDVSQVKFYQGMVKQKGTGAAINKLIDAELTNLDQEIDYFEEWAFRVGEYGSIDSNQIVGAIIPEQQASNNPFVLHFHADGDLPSDSHAGHYHVQGKDLYVKPNNYTGNIFKSRTSTSNTLQDLDSAGYARLQDVEFTLFAEDDLPTLSNRIAELGKGKKIWIASDSTNNWDIRRIDETLSSIIEVKSSNNGYLIYKTDRNHGLEKDDYVIVRAAQPIGRVAKVHSIVSNDEFAVEAPNVEAEILDVKLPMYKLSSVRFTQPSDLHSYTPVSGWDNQEYVWVDKNENGKWEVLQNIRPWTTTGIKTQEGVETNAHNGTSVDINNASTLAVVGAPDQGNGIIRPYVRSEGGVLLESNTTTVSTIGDSVDGFGYSVSVGTDYVIVGAPETQSSNGAVFVYYVDSAGTFNRRPSIRPSDLLISDRFGHSVKASNNGRHIFVGAPGSNKIYAYTLNEIGDTAKRSYTITSDGSSTYTLDFTPISAESLNVVDENGKVYLPNKDWTLVGADIEFTSTPASSLQIVVRQEDHFVFIDMLDCFDAMPGDNYGWDIDCDYYGRYVVIGAPDAAVANSDSTVISGAGEVSIQSQVVQQFAGDGVTRAFTTEHTLQTKIFVEVDGVLLTETENPDIPTDNDGSSEGFYTRSGNTITFKFIPASGAKIVVYTGTFIEKQRITQTSVGEVPTQQEQFGYSVSIDTKGSIIAIGCPGEDETNPNTGSVYILQDSGKKYATVTTNTPHLQTSGDTFYINNKLVTVSSSADNPTNLASDINLANIVGVSASVNSLGEVVITSASLEENNKLTVDPGNTQMFTRDAVFSVFEYTQKINHPNAYENENFGRVVAFDQHFAIGQDNAAGTQNLVISSDRASTLLAVGFDIETNSNSQDYLQATTTFDSNGTTFTDRVTQSGAAYVYELVEPNEGTISNSSKMVFGQQLTSTNISELDFFGTSVAFCDNRIMVGAPYDDTSRGTTELSNSGSLYEFNNNDRASSWAVETSEQDRVDLNLINSIKLFNKKTGEVQVYLDYINPTDGKIAGVAQAELSYISHSDPAIYNGGSWSYKQEYRLWWDTSTVHYLNAQQDDIDFRTSYWGQAFPGSEINVYEWIMSDVPPDQYTGEGFVKDPTKFTTAIVYDSKHNHTRTHWFFWVGGRTSVPVEAEFRSLSADSVRALIEDPKATGLPYLAFLDTDTVALYNCKQYFQDSDIVLSINYDVVKNEGVLHSEFELYGEGNTDQDIPKRILTKLIDSLAGTDSVGNLVPDPFLSDAEKYGVLTQPRQGMFVNRAAALKVLVQYCNSVFVTQPFARNANLSKLLSSENIPTVNSGEYNKSVNSVQERDFLLVATLPTGYKVLVLEDENNNNYWTVYTLQSDDSWLLTNIQGYNTADYWDYATYYATGYDSTTVPKYQVTLEADLLTLTDAVTGDIAKVTSNDEGNFSMFVKTDTGWDEVIIERGTIQFNDSLYDFSQSNSNFEPTGFDNGGFDFAAYDKIPAEEVRQIVNALNEDLFSSVNEIYMNRLFFRLMEYALNESTFTQDWIFKTSFITVAHKIRSLDQFKTFKFDNSQFIEDFINEVKPYKTKLREYVSKYDKLDTYGSDTTDFDVHAFYDEDLLFFRKPSGDYTGDDLLWNQGLNKPWFENYGYKIDSISLIAGGSGYQTDPTVTISAPQLAGGVQATATAKTNGDAIVSVTVTNKGSGYTANPTITITGSGTGVKVSPRMVNTTIRAFDTTIKFDRITYTSTVKDWAANTNYSTNDVIAYQNTTTKTQEVYTAISDFTSGDTFSVENAQGLTVLEIKADADFTNTADRIAAYYYPAEGMLGDDLELLQKGTGYLGNKVTGPGFDQDPGFDSGNFDTVAFDNFEIDSDGLSVLAGLDTNISSLFTDLELGTRPEDINIDGAGFVDTYNSHAPEELIPGRVYDTLDMEVYTHASHDYEKDGNAPEVRYTSFTDVTETLTSFQYGRPGVSADDFEYLIIYKNADRVYNFTIDYNTKQVTLTSPLSATDILHIYAYSVTGEKLVGEYTYEGDGTSINFVLSNIPTLTQQSLVFVDGVETAHTVGQQDNRTLITFATAPSDGAHIHVFTFNQATSRDAPSKIALQTTTMTAGTYTYSLNNTVNYAQPFGANVIVEIDDVRLRPINSKYHTGDGSTTQFAIATTAGETTISNISDIGVAVIQKSDNTTLNAVRNIDYTVTSGDAFITMNLAPADGDTVIVYNRADAEYTISADGTEITIDGGYSFTSSSVMRINTFANHDPLRIQTKVYVGQGTGSVTVIDEFDEVGFDSAGFDRSTVSGTVGTYSVDRTVSNVNNFWVTVDGARLHPGDYITNGSEIVMSSAKQATISGTSVVIITHISENQIQPSTGFRIFKDLNDNFEYLRLCKDATTTVSQAVGITDTKIYLDDASVIPYVTPDSEFPGVVFIGSERVTYFEVNTTDNYITNIRRGTGGTQIYTRIAPGFSVVDGSRDQYLPAIDTHTKTWYDLGSGTAADGLGLQQSETQNAKFLKACEAQVPNYRLELNEKLYVALDYVEDDYVEELL